jgi:phosphoribosylamine--glycine ligase
MKILIIGSGGREHALAWKCAQSADIDQVFVAPGNAGTALEDDVKNIPIQSDDIAGLIAFAKEEKIDLTIVGPEGPLVAGIVDQFQEAELRCFGPSKAAAQLEGSKAFCKDFLNRHKIPTARYATFGDYHTASAYIREQATPLVIKADGLASGKGVIICETTSDALKAAKQMLDHHQFGAAGQRIVVEEFLSGEELSFIVIADGKNFIPLATSQDHKARDNGDVGPNTGGMGAYSPAAVATPELEKIICDTVIQATLNGLIEDGTPYTGFLYAGLMISPEGEAKVLEFNCRFGDPETQPILMRMTSDLVALCNAALDKKCDQTTVTWDERAALGVVLASRDYPNEPKKGERIEGLPAHPDASEKVFHSSTLQERGTIVTNGGRVLCVTALGKNIHEAQARAYALVKKIHWDSSFYRTDIGYRAIAREIKDLPE